MFDVVNQGTDLGNVFVSDMADNPKIMTKLKFRKNRHQIVFCLNDDFRLK